MSYNLKGRSFLKEIDFEPHEMKYFLDLSEALKTAKYSGTEGKKLAGKEIALIFEKPSTRTRVSFETAVTTGSKALRSPCRISTRRRPAPLARAVAMKGSASTSSIVRPSSFLMITRRMFPSRMSSLISSSRASEMRPISALS